MFSIDAKPLVASAQGVDFGALHKSLAIETATYTYSDDTLRHRLDADEVPLFNEFISFCLDSAIPTVLESNPQRQSSRVHFEVRKGETRDRLHVDYDNDIGVSVDNSQLNTFFTISFDLEGNPLSTLFPQPNTAIGGSAIYPDTLTDQELLRLYKGARIGQVAVFDPDRNRHVGSPVERVFFRAKINASKENKRRYGHTQRNLASKRRFATRNPLVSDI